MTLPLRFARLSGLYLMILVAVAGSVSCDPAAVVLNNTASLGGTVPGQRGKIRVAFINNTPFRAIFTFGTYDPQNQYSTPEFEQFYVDPDATNRLEGNSSSQTFQFTCGRVVSVGDAALIARIQSTRATRFNGGPTSSAALQTGIAFSDRPLDDPAADQPTAGRSDPIITLQGAQYQCDSLLVYTFEADATQPDGYRIDLAVILP